MPKVFQGLGQNDIYLPVYGKDVSGLASYDVQSDTILVPATPPNYDNIKDIVRVSLCGIDLKNDRCHKHEFVVNGASSRCMINVLLINENGVDAVPGDIHFKIRQSSKCIPTVRFDGIFSPSTNGENWGVNGLLVQIGGMLSSAWEVQAEVVPSDATPTPSSYSWVLEFIFDRLGDVNQVIKGPNTTGTFLPP